MCLLFLPGDGRNSKDPVWKCVCTLSGYHTRTIYDVDWYDYRIIDNVCCELRFYLSLTSILLNMVMVYKKEGLNCSKTLKKFITGF